jgi:transposase-like protein
MRAPRVPVEEQYRLIMECRKSGLSDYQWCLNNDINPGTFYNWVKRLRKNGCGDIPEKNQLSTYEQSHQEVVKIEMNSISVPTDMNTDTAAMELMIGNMNLRISNETDPLLLAKTIQILTELSC